MIIRSIIFDILLAIWGVIIPILYSSAFLFKESSIADKGAKTWSVVAIWALKKICGIKYEVRGLENIPKDTGCIIACKHQSAWETIIMHLIFCYPAYAYKKELLKIPFYGWFLTKMSGITIDRDGGIKSLKSLISDSKKFLDRGQNIILFPQGTRTPIDANITDYPYQSGIAALYSSLKYPVIPVALNSGYFWEKRALRKKPGTIIIEFLPAIPDGLTKKEFLENLQTRIEEKSNQLKPE